MRIPIHWSGIPSKPDSPPSVVADTGDTCDVETVRAAPAPSWTDAR